MATEKDLEDAIAAHPELIEEGLILEARQAIVLGRRIDLLFRDRHGRQLLVELKWGAIKDEHIGQLLSYEGTLISGDHPDLRVMLVGTRVPPSFQRALDHHGIAWREVRPGQIATLLKQSDEHELAARFQESNALSEIFPRRDTAKLRPEHGTRQSLASASRAKDGATPALLSVVDSQMARSGAGRI